jgi:hypothetical protein
MELYTEILKVIFLTTAVLGMTLTVIFMLIVLIKEIMGK